MATNVQPIIIKKVKKAHAGHHGGAWKVACADFVTAMMAFFLLLWLLNATTEVQKAGISDYFSPATVSKSSGGAGGLLGGRTVSSPGAMSERTTVPSLSMALEPTTGDSEGQADVKGSSDGAEESSNAKGGASDGAEQSEEAKIKAKEELEKKEEESRFSKIKEKLLEQVDKDTDFRMLAENLMVEKTAEGLRIQIIDKKGAAHVRHGRHQNV